MSVAVGYVATQEGRAALSAAIGEAVLRKTALQIMGPIPGEGAAEAESDIRQAIAAAAAAGVRLPGHGGKGRRPARVPEHYAVSAVPCRYQVMQKMCWTCIKAVE